MASSQADSKANGDDEDYIQSQVFHDDTKDKTDEDDANSEIGQVDINDDSKWDTDIEQEGLSIKK